jgi:hypothetical protein
MKEEDILEGNKLIVDFMDHDKEYMQETDTYGSYHESWDWLMPVIKKIQVVLKDLIVPFGNEDYDTITDSLLRIEIEECFESVVEFIKWFNQQKQS